MYPICWTWKPAAFGHQNEFNQSSIRKSEERTSCHLVLWDVSTGQLSYVYSKVHQGFGSVDILENSTVAITNSRLELDKKISVWI